MEISVVLCSMNGEKYIREQLDSIINQTLLIDELIIVDDASSDGTIDIINEFIAINNSFKINLIKHNVNIGIIQSFQEGIKNCRGQYIFLCDQDDIWYKVKIERFIEKFKSDNYNLVFSNATLINEVGDKLDKSFFDKLELRVKEKLSIVEGNSDKVLAKRNVISGSMMAFRKDSIRDINFPTEHRHLLHDRFIASIISAENSESIGLIDEPLSYYRIHENQFMGFNSTDKTVQVDRQEYFEEQLEILNKILMVHDNLHFRRAHYFWYIRATLCQKTALQKFIAINTLYLQNDYSRFVDYPIREALKDLFK